MLDRIPVAAHVEAKKRKKDHEINRKFQETRRAKFPWAKATMYVDGSKVSNVKCIICTTAESRVRVFVNKPDSLRKHLGRRIAKTNQVVGNKVKT